MLRAIIFGLTGKHGHEDLCGGGIEAAGIRDVLAKSLGSSNHANVVKATLAALAQLRLREEILSLRGIRASKVAVQS